MINTFIMTPQEIYKKTDDVISKFKNGKEMYRKSALFNKTIQMLVRGVDEYDMIEQLIMVTEDTKNAFEQYIHRDERPILINNDKYTPKR